MTIIDDPLLALILRFVVKEEGSDTANQAFIQTQVRTLQKHLEQYPEEEQGERALKWIETHAENYRREWQRQTVAKQAVSARCGDCPLAGSRSSHPCRIHDDWVELLNTYISRDIGSSRYVEQTLKLLQDNKEQLCVSRDFDRVPASTAGLSK